MRVDGGPGRPVPRVSIGLPVFNGENYLAEALAAHLAQSMGDFELIVSDNASTDGTETICRWFAARDERIRYVRNPTNLGAAANYNQVLALAQAPFFRWAAHDDLLEPDFLAQSLAALEARPEAVLCITGARRIDAAGAELLRWSSPLHGSEQDRPSARFGAVVRTFHCHWTEIFGLARRAALVRTMGHRPFRGTDIALIAELALLGPFVRLDLPLFVHREHQARYYNTADRDPDACLAWYDPDRQGDRVWHKWRLYRSHLAALRRHPLPVVERARCGAQLVQSMLMWVNLKGLARDVGWSLDPRLIRWERQLRRWLAAPPGSPRGLGGGHGL